MSAPGRDQEGKFPMYSKFTAALATCLTIGAFAAPAQASERHTIRVAPGKTQTWTTTDRYRPSTWYTVSVNGQDVFAEAVPGSDVAWLYKSGTVVKVYGGKGRWTFVVTNVAVHARNVRVHLR